MAEDAGKEDGIRRIAELIKGSHMKPRKAKPKEKAAPQEPTDGEKRLQHVAGLIGGSGRKKEARAKTAAIASETNKIGHLVTLMTQPSKSIMNSGNLPDLNREMARIKAQATELAGKILEIQARLRRTEQGRNTIQSELDALKAQETKLQEEMVSQWQAESSVREELDVHMKEKSEAEIADEEATASLAEISLETKKVQKELKDLQKRRDESAENVRHLPDRLAKTDAQMADNTRKISECEKRVASLDKDTASAQANLESAIASQRQVAQEYDRVAAEKSQIEDAYSLFENVDKIKAQKDAQNKLLDGIRAEIASKEEAAAESETQRKNLKAALDAEEDNQKKLQKDIESAVSKLRGVESKFAVYAELDDAAKDAAEAVKKLEAGQKALDALREGAKTVTASIDAAKKELQATNEKEALLKKKLDEVLHEKQRLEEDLQAMSSDAFPSEKLIIELPDVLRDAIKKETEKLSTSQASIEALSTQEKSLKDQEIKLKDQLENDTKNAKAKEKQLLYIKNKLGESGYDEGERLLLKRQIDSAGLEKKETDARIKASDAERKHLKSSIAKNERNAQKLRQEIEELGKKAEEAKNTLLRLEEEMKANRERRIKAWAGPVPLLRLLYPLKSQMDAVLDERSKIKAELEEAARVQKKAETDLDSAEKYVEKCRSSLSSMEEEYVSLQTQMHTLEKQNIQLRADKDSLAKEAKDEEEHLPLMEADAQAHAARLAELKNQTADKTALKKEHEKGIRQAETGIAKAQKALEAQNAQIKQAEAKITAANQKLKALSASVADENTKIIKLLDEKQTMDKQLQDYKKQEAIIESEIKIIAGIYEKP